MNYHKTALILSYFTVLYNIIEGVVSIIAGFFVALAGYLWGSFFVSTYVKAAEKNLLADIDKVVIDAPDVTEFDLRRIARNAEEKEPEEGTEEETESEE